MVPAMHRPCRQGIAKRATNLCLGDKDKIDDVRLHQQPRWRVIAQQKPSDSALQKPSEITVVRNERRMSRGRKWGLGGMEGARTSIIMARGGRRKQSTDLKPPSRCHNHCQAWTPPNRRRCGATAVIAERNVTGS